MMRGKRAKDAFRLNVEKDTMCIIGNNVLKCPFQGVLAVLVFINGDGRG